MRILQLISSGGYYGAENMIMNLTKSLESRGHRCTLGLFWNKHLPNEEFAEVGKAAGLAVERITCEGRVDWGAVRAIGDCVRKHEIDIIHCHGYKPDVYALAAKRKTPARLVATCHTWAMDAMDVRALQIYKRIDGFCLRHFDQTVAVSASIADDLRGFGIPQRRIATIPNGIDLSKFAAGRRTLRGQFGKGDGLVVGVVAQLMPRKGHEYLLRAAPEILARFPDTRFVFAGDGVSRSALESLAQELGIGESVTFLGKRRDMPDLYASMDILALPSLDEGMPMTILEALAAKKPYIATPVGDIPKLILHEQTGLLVEPQDVAGLRDAVMRLLADPGLRNRLGTGGFELVQKNFSADAMAANYLNVYGPLLQ